MSGQSCPIVRLVVVEGVGDGGSAEAPLGLQVEGVGDGGSAEATTGTTS